MEEEEVGIERIEVAFRRAAQALRPVAADGAVLHLELHRRVAPRQLLHHLARPVLADDGLSVEEDAHVRGARRRRFRHRLHRPLDVAHGGVPGRGVGINRREALQLVAVGLRRTQLQERRPARVLVLLQRGAFAVVADVVGKATLEVAGLVLEAVVVGLDGREVVRVHAPETQIPAGGGEHAQLVLLDRAARSVRALDGGGLLELRRLRVHREVDAEAEFARRPRADLLPVDEKRVAGALLKIRDGQRLAVQILKDARERQGRLGALLDGPGEGPFQNRERAAVRRLREAIHGRVDAPRHGAAFRGDGNVADGVRRALCLQELVGHEEVAGRGGMDAVRAHERERGILPLLGDDEVLVGGVPIDDFAPGFGGERLAEVRKALQRRDRALQGGRRLRPLLHGRLVIRRGGEEHEPRPGRPRAEHARKARQVVRVGGVARLLAGGNLRAVLRVGHLHGAVDVAPRVVHAEHERDDGGVPTADVLLEARPRGTRVVATHARVVEPHGAVRVAGEVEIGEHLHVGAAVRDRIAPEHDPVAVPERRRPRSQGKAGRRDNHQFIRFHADSIA